MNSTQHTHKPSLWSIILPGFLVAATGVGAGDLATASFTGSQLGLAILWAVVLGGVLKYVLTEGLARWQLVTGETLLEGIAQRGGRAVGIVFLPYMLLWSFFVGSAIMSACGVTLYAMLPVFSSASEGKIAFGILCSVAGLALVHKGSFALFEQVMTACIGVMFTVVLVTAGLLWPGTEAVLSGLFIPSIPDMAGAGITWTIALMGGVGGTLTILCYGYWIREKGRTHADAIATCRVDLAFGYGATVLFGLAMVIIGSTIDIEGRGAGLLVTLADRLEASLGVAGRWFFLVGAFSAVFSSLLGVWQAVPYLFADVWRLFIRTSSTENAVPLAESQPYRVFLWLLAGVPMIGLFFSFKEVQKFYAVIGASFMPLLAMTLLILNGRKQWVGEHRNGILTVCLLLATLVFFGALAWKKWT